MRGIVEIKPLSSLLFREPGEIDPWVKGPATVARGRYLPSPSTIAGALAFIMYKRKKCLKGEDWVDEIRYLLGNIKLRGTYLFDVKNGAVYIEHKNNLIELTNLLKNISKYTKILIKAKTFHDYEQSKNIIASLQEKGRKENKQEDNVMENLAEKYDKIGIALNRKKKIKIVKENYLYSFEYTSYSSDARIAVDIEGSNLIEYEDIIRIGGKGGKGVVKIKNTDPLIPKHLGKEWEKNHTQWILYAVSPILVSDISNAIVSNSKECLSNMKGACIIPSLKFDEMKSLLKADFEIKYIIGSISLVATGYSLSRNRRKPLYPAIDKGSIIVAENINDPEDVYWKGLGFASDIGYGTVIPYPLKP